MHKQKSIIVIVLIIVFVVLAALLVTRQISVQSPIVFLDEPQQVMIDTTEGKIASERDTIVPLEIDQKNQTPKEKALAQYEGRVLAFDTECTMYPRTMTVKNNTTIMLNNRSNYERIIVVGSRNYVVAPDGYALAANNRADSYVVACDDYKAGMLEVVR